MMNTLKIFKIHPSTIIFILCSFLVGYFKNIIYIFIIVIIHECGHLFFIKLFKYHVISITIYPFGGITKVSKKINDSSKKDRLISLGGILFQLFLFLIIHNDLFLFYNKTILLFNIIPIIPLDGSVFLKSILEEYFSYEKSLLYTEVFSVISLIIFLYCNFYYKINNYFIIIVLLYQLYYYHKEKKFLKNRFYLERYLYSFPYKSIINENKEDYHKLRKNHRHYFYNGKSYLNEKEVLGKYFTCQ